MVAFLGRGLAQGCLCFRAARGEGFNTLVLMATLPGEPFYRALGFREVERVDLPMPDGVTADGVLMQRQIAPKGD